MPEVYNSTTIEFQTRRPNYASKYGLVILGGVSIGIGLIVFFTSILVPEEPPSWIPLLFSIVLILIGVGVIVMWKFWDRGGGRGFHILKPRPRDKECLETGQPIIVQAQEEEFMNQEGRKNSLTSEDLSIQSSNSVTPTPIPGPTGIPEHYKPRHFSSHGYGKRPPRIAPLAKAEDITPSLRSSYSSLAYVQEFDSESSISIDSALFHDVK